MFFLSVQQPLIDCLKKNALKLTSKTRHGLKQASKQYDKAKTPYQRVMLSQHISEGVKEALKKQYINLDPITIQTEMRSLQKQLWATAWSGSIGTVAEKKAADMKNVPVETSYRKTRKPRKEMKPRNWLTRKDPFGSVTDIIDFELRLNPNITAKNILDKLIEKNPIKFKKSQIRTLQRRVKIIRDEESKREAAYQEFMIDKKDMATKKIIDDIINSRVKV